MSYRIETSKTKQAGCQNKPCKDEGIKIQKGELRFGSWVVVQEHGSFRWRHWGCVSGKVLENLREYLEQGDPDTGYKWDYFDGLDELEPSDQEKVKKAVIEGKIADEDWKGDPEFNMLGQSGTVKKAPRKKKVEEDNNEDVHTSSDPPKKGRGKKSKSKAEDDNEGEDLKLAKKPRGKKAKIEDDEETKPAGKSERKVTTEVKDEGDQDDSAPAPMPKSRAKRAVKDEPVSGDEERPVQKAATKGRVSKKEPASSDADISMDDIPQKNGLAKSRVKAEIKSGDEKDIKPTKAASKKTPAKKNGNSSVKMDNGDDEAEDVKPAKAAATKKKPAIKEKVKKEESTGSKEEVEVKSAAPSRADRAAKRAASDINENKKPAKRGKKALAEV